MADSVRPKQSTRLQSTFGNHQTPAISTALLITQSPPRASAVALQDIDSLTTLFGLLRLPNRRKMHCRNIVPLSTFTAVITNSPRHGQASKLSRLTRPPAITTIKEFVQF